MENNGLTWSDGGDLLEAFLGNIEGNFNSNTQNGSNVSQINAAVAENIRSAAKAREERTKGLLQIVLLAVVGIIVVSLVKNFWK